MKDNQRILLQLLLQSKEPLSSAYLSKELHLSVRTVKNYVKEINKMSDQRVIFSSNLGYSVLRQEAIHLMNDDFPIPQNFKERAYFIVKKKLVHHEELNTFDICEELFISYSTLKADLAKMNTFFGKYKLRFYTQNDSIQIEGHEKKKRALLSHIIFEEGTHQLININTLKKSFVPDYVDQISDIIRSFFTENEFYYNDFSFMNLILHLLILVDRVKNGKYINNRRHEPVDLQQNIDLSKLYQQIEQAFSLELFPEERTEIDILIRTTANFTIKDSLSELLQVVEQDIIENLYLLLNQIKNIYGIDLCHEPFIVPFALHIRSLISRSKENRVTKNPMLETIKKECPMIYDIAIFVSLQLSNDYQIKICEDEVAFLSIHIGAELDRQKSNHKKIKCILFCPHYLSIESRIRNQLLLDFSEDIIITESLSQIEDWQTLCCDILFTVVEVPTSENYRVMQISPFQIEGQKKEIYDVIDEVRERKKKEILIHKFDDFFDSQLFTVIKEEENRQVILPQMCQKMVDYNYVDSSFLMHVIERETASSTAFSGIAIPHSIYMDALKTTISVRINKAGIQWGSSLVYVVLLISINEMDKQRFIHIYETLLSTFDNSNAIHLVKKISTFKDFKDFIFLNI